MITGMSALERAKQHWGRAEYMAANEQAKPPEQQVEKSAASGESDTTAWSWSVWTPPNGMPA